jgi:hypothetical protein
VSGRYPEDRYDSVTDQLLDGASVPHNDIGCGVDEPPDNPSEDFRVQTRARAGGRGEIEKGDRHGLPTRR